MGDVVVPGGPVLGDVDGQFPGHRRDDAGEQLADGAGLDQPVHRGDRQARRLHGYRAWPVHRLAAPWLAVRAEQADVVRGVEVDAEEVERRTDHGEVAVPNQAGRRGGGVRGIAVKQPRVATVEDRLQV